MNNITGDWDDLESLFKNFSKDLKKDGAKFMNESAKMVKRTVQDNIKNGEGMKPLKPNTIAKKGSSKILIETGTLLDSIEIEMKGDFEFVVKPTGDNPSGLSNEQQAIYHEYGTDVIPPRPFMKPSYEESEPKIKEGISEVVSNIINKYT